MAAAGIICEYNPFHRGHAWQLAELRRRLGADTPVVGAMSGDFVQRGECAILSAHARAEAAVRGGVDLVLELPVAGATASAEGFAAAGVALLAATGVVDTLVFGSECADAAALTALARTLLSPEFSDALRAELRAGDSFAAARERAARSLVGDAADILTSPNDILGVEYCKAIVRQGASLRPLPLPRRGAAHDGGASADGFASASHIRALLRAGEDADAFLTPESAALYRREAAAGRAPCTLAHAERAMLSRLRTLTEADFARYDGGNEGLGCRVYNAVQRETSIEAILTAAKSKRYAHARLRRLLLRAWLDLPASLAPTQVPYLRVLACNARGRALLHEMKRSAAAPLLTKSADVRALGGEAQRAFAYTARTRDQFALTCPDFTALPMGSAWTSSPVIL